MTSSINANNIDGNYPVAGVPNNTQGFRDNFNNIKTNFQYASDEITDLQNKVVLKSALTGGTLNNNMNGSLIYNVELGDISYTYAALTATAGTIEIDYSAAQFQQVSPTGSVSLNFTNWPATGKAGVVRVGFNITNTAYTVTLPAAVSQGINLIAGVSPGTPGVSNTITFGTVGNYAFEFVTVDNGATIWIFDDSRSPGKINTQVDITNTTASTSDTTGALTVAGGVGIAGNLNVGANLTTYTSTGNTAFQALDTGFISIYAPTVPGNSSGALNIIGSTGGNYVPLVNAGGMIHITGNDGTSARTVIDSFGSNASAGYSGVILRRGRGTAASPTAAQSGDVIARIGATAYGNVGFITISGNSASSIDFVATENQTSANAGIKMEFYTTATGTASRTLSLALSNNLATFAGNVSAGNVSATAFYGDGSTLSNIYPNYVFNGTSYIGIGASGGNANISVGGTANVVVVTNTTVRVNGSGGLALTDGGTMGYTNGAGGTVAQSGNKTQGVTLDKPSGEITMQNTNLSGGSSVSFTFTNSTIGAHDLLLINMVGGGTLGAYYFGANCTTGSAVITVSNRTASTLGEALVLRYAVIKGSIA